MAEKMLDDLRIGDFSKPVAPTGSTPKNVLENAEEQLRKEVQAVEDELRPMATYEEKLKEAKITREQAAQIVDAVLLQGFYSEEVQITKTVKARLRTRTARDTQRAQNHIEAVRPVYDSHYYEIMTRFLIAASLEAFGKTAFEHPPRSASREAVEEAFANRLLYVESMPDPAYRILAGKLRQFDAKIALVLEEGAIENF